MAKDNTSRFWKKNIERQKAETLFELIEENNKNTLKANKKTYKNPVVSAIENNNIIRSIKKATSDLREEIKEK